MFEDERASAKLRKQIVGLSSLEMLETPRPDGNEEYELGFSFVPPTQNTILLTLGTKINADL